MITFTLIDHPDYRAPERTTDTARRINSVLPMLTGMARRWLRHRPARQRTLFDVEDLLQELWAELITKDRKYDTARSRYTTFSRMVAWQRLAELADQLDREPRQEALGFDPAADDTDPVVEVGHAAGSRSERPPEARADLARAR
jgi:DNA-directed RNA polymerase specialized sigma24 family protein